MAAGSEAVISADHDQPGPLLDAIGNRLPCCFGKHLGVEIANDKDVVLSVFDWASHIDRPLRLAANIEPLIVELHVGRGVDRVDDIPTLDAKRPFNIEIPSNPEGML